MKRALAAWLLALAAAPAFGAVAPSPEGAAMCEEKGEGTHTANHRTGMLKMRVVCRDGDKGAAVRYAWYFDETGRQVREEDLVPGAPDKSRIVLNAYELSSREPVSTEVYDGKGGLLQKSGAAAPVAGAKRGKPQRAVATYGEYVQACKEAPNDLLYWMLGGEKEPQFFTDEACRCVADRAVRAGEGAASPAWRKSTSLDPSNPKHRLAVAAMQNLNDCLCPHAFPDSRLEKLCPKAAEIEKAWK